ncbi:MAG: SHOCT domain-containing protein [Burkholderiaceae bacterium]|nr:SHOCT domain-containing protein [Burkholderiaceae bacterium]
MMGGYGVMGQGGWFLGMVFMVLMWLLVAGGVVALFKYLFTTSGSARGGGRSSALEVLGERYARGEIDKAEFEAKRKDLKDL